MIVYKCDKCGRIMERTDGRFYVDTRNRQGLYYDPKRYQLCTVCYDLFLKFLYHDPTEPIPDDPVDPVDPNDPNDPTIPIDDGGDNTSNPTEDENDDENDQP